jgi:hypothetical protein
MSRYFTIESVEKADGTNVDYTGGRFKSNTPRLSAPKMFSKVYHHLNASGPLTLTIKVREITQGSKKKLYEYKVSKQNQKTVVEKDGKTITYNFATRIKAL